MMIDQNTLVDLASALLHSTSGERSACAFSSPFYGKRETSGFFLCFPGSFRPVNRRFALAAIPFGAPGAHTPRHGINAYSTTIAI